MLRKIFLLFVLFSASTYAFAQNKKGDILLSASMEPFVKRFSVYSSPWDKANAVNIRTNYRGGYYVLNRLAAGISAGYNYQSAIYTIKNERFYNNIYLAGIFTRYTLPIWRFGIVAEAGYRVGLAKGKILESYKPPTDEYVKYNYRSGVRAFNYSLGINYQVSKKLAVEVLAFNEKGSYFRKITKQDYQPFFQNGAIHVGVLYFISNKKNS